MRNHGPPWQIILIFILFPPLAMAVMFILWLKSGRHIGTSSSFERSDDVSSSSSSGDSGGSDSFSGGDGGSSGGGGAGGDW
jgi:uncharacterized membrane protein YgcG